MADADAEATGRPQDQGRPHRARGKPSPATSTLLARYHAAMRSELEATLVEIAGATVVGLLETEVKRPPLADRMKLWDLAIKLGRELGTEVDPGPLPGDPAPAAKRSGGIRRGRVDFGGPSRA